MIVRLLSASLLLATAATAQNDPPAAKPAAEAPSQEGQGQDPGAVLSQLKAEKERLQREIAYAKQRAANANQMLAQKLARTEPQIASIDAGITRPARPQPMQINKATMMSADARQEFGADALIAVDGTPVKQAEFDTMMEYMRTLENTGDDAMRGQRIMFELIRTNSVASKFPQNNALEQAKVVQKAMAGGTTAAELVKTNAAVLGAQPDGSVTITRNSFLGTGVEMAAFALAEGEISAPIRNVFGYVVLQCEKFEKGSTKELDKIQAKAVQVRFSDDEEALNTAQANASRGQVEIQVRDEATMSMLPAMYRPAPAVPAQPAAPRASLMKQLTVIKARIAQIGDAPGDTEMAELKSLQKQKAELETALQNLPPVVPTGDIDAGKVEPPDGPVKPGRKVRNAIELQKTGDPNGKKGK